MGVFLQLSFIVALFVLVRSADIAISSGKADPIRAICYGIVAVLALIGIILVVIGGAS